MTDSPDAMRQVIREIVREVIREVVAEEMAAGSVVERPANPPGRVEHRSAGAALAGASSDALHVSTGALTERHLRALGDTATIRIGRRVVITPLARDWARSRGIDIIRIDG